MTMAAETIGDRVLRGIGFAVLTFGLFSASDATVKWLSADYSIFQILFFSTVTAFLPVGAFVTASGGLATVKPRYPGLVWLRSFLVTGTAIFTVLGFSFLPLTEGYAIIFSGPLIVTVMSVLFLKEKVGWHRWAAVFVGFLGVMVMLRPGFQEISFGHVCALIATTLFAASNIVLRGMGRGENIGALLIILLVSTLIVTGPVMAAVWKTPTLPHLATMCLAGLFAGSAQIFLVAAFREAPVATVSPFQYTQMIWAVVLGYLLFGDQPQFFTMTGAAIVIASGLYLLWRESRLEARARS